jgi:hypothetical protein
MLDPSNISWPDSTVCSLVKQAILLEKNYKEMLLQGDEVNLRIQLWRGAMEICKAESEGVSCTRI